MSYKILGGLGVLLLSGCGGTGSIGPTGPGVRALNGLANVPQAIVKDGNTTVSYVLPYATESGIPRTPYSIVPTGNQTVTISNYANSKAIASTSIDVPNSTVHYNEIAYDAAKPTFLTLLDEFSIPTTADLRFVNASAVTGPVDILYYPPNTSSIVKYTLSPGQVGPAQPSGAYAYQSFTSNGPGALQIYPAGHDIGTPLFQETINIATGTSFTFIVLDPTSGSAPVVLGVQDNQLNDVAP